MVLEKSMYDWRRSPVLLELRPGSISPCYISVSMAQHLSRYVDDVARGISEFGAVIILTYYPMVTSTLIYERLRVMD